MSSSQAPVETSSLTCTGYHAPASMPRGAWLARIGGQDRWPGSPGSVTGIGGSCGMLGRRQPHVIVVEGGAAIGCRRRGAGERIDAPAALELIVGRDALDDHHAALQAIEGFGRK